MNNWDSQINSLQNNSTIKQFILDNNLNLQDSLNIFIQIFKSININKEHSQNYTNISQNYNTELTNIKTLEKFYLIKNNLK